MPDVGGLELYGPMNPYGGDYYTGVGGSPSIADLAPQPFQYETPYYDFGQPEVEPTPPLVPQIDNPVPLRFQLDREAPRLEEPMQFFNPFPAPEAGGIHGFEVPYVSPFLRETVQPFVGDVGADVFGLATRGAIGLNPLGVGANALSSLGVDIPGYDQIVGAGESLGRTVAEPLVPVTGEELALSALTDVKPLLNYGPRAVRGGLEFGDEALAGARNLTRTIDDAALDLIQRGPGLPNPVDPRSYFPAGADEVGSTAWLRRLDDEAARLGNGRDVGAIGGGDVPQGLVKWDLDTANPQTYSARSLGNAGHIEGDEISAIHVTSDPQPVINALKRGQDLATTRAEGKFGDLGPGLYASDAPQMWTGRAVGKWSFLDEMTPEQTTDLIAALRRDIQASPNAANFEKQYALRDIADVERGVLQPSALIVAADQPFMVQFWKPEYLAKLGIKPGAEPIEVPVRLKGRFAELARSPYDEAEVQALKAAGYDGAYVSGGISNAPQIVVWNNDAVRQFGDYAPTSRISRLSGEAGAIRPGGEMGAISPSPEPVAPPEPTVVDRLTDVINSARKLPEETEALRHAERQQRVAMGANILEQGGRTPEAYKAARAAHAGEMPRAAFEMPTETFTPDEVDDLRAMLSQADLRHYEELNAESALTKVLDGRLNEIRNFELELLDRVYGPKLSMAIAEKIAPPNLQDKVYEFWLSNVLSGPITQLRNITGNLATALTTPFEQLGAAALEQGVARAQGRAVERFWQEAPATMIGMVRGLPEGVTGALRVFKEGFNPVHAGRIEHRTRAIGGPAGQLIRLPLTGLEAADTFFRAINFEASKHALAVRAARREGLTGESLSSRVADLLANPSDDLIDQASKRTEAALFRDDPTKLGSWLLSGKEKVPALNFIVPFVKTPDRLIAYGIRRSPLGLLDTGMWRRLMAGNPEAVDELTQTLMGSTIAAGIGGLTAAGVTDLTAGPPTDPAARDRFYREGKQPFSIKIPGLGWVQYNQIPALAETLTMVAATTEAVREGKRPDEAAAQAVVTIGQSLADRSYLSGLSDLMDALQDPDRYAETFASRWITGFVPYSGALRQTAQAMDQTVRKPEGIAEQIQAGIPGLTDNVPPRLTAFGEEAERSFPSPITISPETQDAIDAELERLNTEVSFVGNSIGGKKLTREEQFEYQQEAGQLTYRALETLIQSPFYAQMSDALKEMAIRRAIDQARDRVRAKFNLRNAQRSLESQRELVGAAP